MADNKAVVPEIKLHLAFSDNSLQLLNLYLLQFDVLDKRMKFAALTLVSNKQKLELEVFIAYPFKIHSSIKTRCVLALFAQRDG